MRPTVVCLCGSTRFGDAFREAQLKETFAGKIVLTIGCDTKDDTSLFRGLSFTEQQSVKYNLDQLHFRKVEMADEVLFLNVGGYMGLSTCDEYGYALALKKRIRFLEEPA